MRRLPDELGFSLRPDIKKLRALPKDLGFIDREQLMAAQADYQRNEIMAAPSFGTPFDQQNEARFMTSNRLGSQTTISKTDSESRGMNYSPS
jgi:hypothetical protein